MSREVILFQDASIRPKNFALILTERDCALQIPASGGSVLSTFLDHHLL